MVISLKDILLKGLKGENYMYEYTTYENHVAKAIKSQKRVDLVGTYNTTDFLNNVLRDFKSIFDKEVAKLEEKFEDRFKFKNIKFSQLKNLKLKNENVRGVLFDLGYSYTQIKDPNKGLSFDSIGKLNMQLGLNSFSAEEAINKLDQKELEKIFKFFGDEKDGKYIARNIFKERMNKKIDTQGLVKIIDGSKRRNNFRINNSKHSCSNYSCIATTF